MGRSMETLILLTVVKIAIIPSVFVMAATAAVASQALPGCDEWCGEVQIPYPFGTREGCYLNETFFIECNTTHYDSPKAFLTGGNVNVTNISISGELQILNLMAQDCYPPKIGPDVFSSIFLHIPGYTISSTKNKFIAIGCDTLGFISGQSKEDQSFTTACVALCDDISSVKDGACSGNGCCQLEIPSGLNYLEIQCLEGFEGNPYLPQGCQDIDECKDESLNECKYECVNTIGNYTCNCPKDFKGDGRRGGEGVTVGFAVLVIGSTWLYLGYKNWKFIKLKKFFQNNGSLMLQQHLSQWQSSTDMVRIFTQEELDKATNKYDETAVVGKGGYGTVYKGVLDDDTRSIVGVRVHHQCTLYDHVHGKANQDSLPLEARLRIASGTAGVISYLHSSASTPIIHRDIKTTNILLDHNYTAKVSDFGASKLVPIDQSQLSTMVQGTLGYLDPEYLLTSELTEKSDVYSFGIGLLELITGKKAVSFEGPEAEINLAMYVLCAMKEDRVVEVVEKGMATEANIGQIKEAAKLATKCLRIRGEERPSMKEVAMELEGLRVLIQANEKLESTGEAMVGYLVQSDGGSESTSNQFTASGSTNVVDDSMKVEILPLIHHGR
ncbi:unnamed protein product [Citrullus colocynthis]|uniref:Uncharacterized protein n=1 Tax=Citrullus colocynthis TaxID=252529 RepID=A0ABP0Y1F7_9ROSI